jgi:general secretion pathway protein F
VTGTGYRILVNLRFAQTMSLLLRGGVQLVDGLELAGESTGSLWLGRLLREEAEQVRHGRSLSAALKNVPYLNASLPGWISAGEAGGSLEAMLDQAARRFQQRWAQYVRRNLSLLEPLLVLAVGVFVFLVALAVLLPILSLNQAIR